MATLKNYNYSIQGEQPELAQQPIDVEKHIVEKYRKENDPATTTEYHLFKLVGNTRKGSVYIPNIDDALNPETKKVERMRLLSGVSSVWIKDQDKLDPVYIRNNGRSLIFPRGTRILRIPAYDETALFFARNCSHNIGNPNRKTGSRFEFYEYDPAAIEKEQLERESLAIDMAIEARQAKSEDMRKHALFLGISLTNSVGLPKTDEGIRVEYQRYANRNPEYFKQTLGSKEVNISYLVKMAISDSKIEIGREPGKIYWSNGGGLITAIAPKEDPVKALVNLALSNTDERKAFKDQLQSKAK